MKLLLSDGTSINLSSYEKTTTTLNGDPTDALELHVTDISLEKVKSLFGDESNLDTVEIYTDNDVFKDKYNGYQIRKTISLGEQDNEFVVVIAKGTSTTERVNALSADFKELASSVENALSVFEKVNQNVLDLTSTLNDVVSSYGNIGTTLEAQTNTINSVAKTAQESADTAGEFKNSVDNLSALVKDLNERVISVEGEHTALGDSLNEAISQMGNALKLTTDLEVTYNSHINEVTAALEETRNVKEVAAENDNTVKQALEQVKKVDDSLASYDEKITKQDESISSAVETVENGKTQIESIDARVTKLEPITDITTLSLSEAKTVRATESREKLVTWLEDHPIVSSCHGGEEAIYSITAEKQSYLQSMILIATTAAANGQTDFKPSWNASGEQCTYDWTLAELQQLALEIEAAVRPLISYQQTLEKEIMDCTDMDALVAVVIDYANAPAHDEE